MANAVLHQIYSSRIDAIERITNGLKIRSLADDAPRSARELEDLTRECCEISRQLTEAWARLIDCPNMEESDDPRHEGTVLGEQVNRCLKAFSKVGTLIKRINRSNYAIDGCSGLISAMYELSRIHDQIASTWPSRDMRLIEESGEAYERGEYQTAEEILNELCSSHS